MIVTRAPLRLTFGGGGTDLPAYSEKFGGFCVAAAINKYVYISINRNFTGKIILKYSKLENVSCVESIEHPLIRTCLQVMHMDGLGLEICSMADIPAGTGLGSSSAFTVALLKGLYAVKREPVSAQKLAEMACEVEIERLKEPIGRQDQYISAVGGITSLRFSHTGIFSFWGLPMADQTLADLEENILLFFTGYTRSASAILGAQQNADENLHRVKQSGVDAGNALGAGDMLEFVRQLNVQWGLKEARGRSPDQIREARDGGMAAGALACKLIGAGGGGFLMFYAPHKRALRLEMARLGLQEVRFSFDYEGAKIL